MTNNNSLAVAVAVFFGLLLIADELHNSLNTAKSYTEYVHEPPVEHWT